MPRPKKTTPTVATTEPDTNMNPDRAQVAAVADLPHAPEPVVVDTPPPTLESVLAAKDATIAEQSARIALMDVERANHRKEIEMWMNAVQKVTAERDERDARIAELEARAKDHDDILRVLESQSRATNARSGLIRLRNERLQNRIDLHLALGGDFKTAAS